MTKADLAQRVRDLEAANSDLLAKLVQAQEVALRLLQQGCNPPQPVYPTEPVRYVGPWWGIVPPMEQSDGIYTVPAYGMADWVLCSGEDASG